MSKLLWIVLASIGLATLCPAPSPGAGIHDEEEFLLLHDDLVVRATIVSIECEVIRMDEWIPGGPRPDRPYPITVLGLDDVQVLRGPWDGDQLTVVAGGGYPPTCEPLRRGMPIAEGVSFNYEVGDDVILSLWFSDHVRNGSYLISIDSGRYKRIDESWQNQGSGTVRTMQDIVEVTTRGTVSYLIKQANVILEGRIRTVSVPPDSPGRVGRIGRVDRSTVQMDVQDVWKGEYPDRVIEFRVVEKPGGRFAWKAYVPGVEAGQTWVVFLGRDDAGYYPIGDRNGMMKLDGDQLLVAGKLASSMGPAEFKRMIATREKQ